MSNVFVCTCEYKNFIRDIQNAPMPIFPASCTDSSFYLAILKFFPLRLSFPFFKFKLSTRCYFILFFFEKNSNHTDAYMYVEKNVTVSSLNLSLELREPENGIPFPTLFFNKIVYVISMA